MDNQKPTKQDFVNLINQIAGDQIVDVQKLDKILQGAQQSYQETGMNGLFDYMRKVVQAPVSNDQMRNMLVQMSTIEGMQELLKQMNLPFSHLPPRCNF